MKRHLVIRLVPLLALCLLAPGRAEAHAYHPHWTRCTINLDWQTMTHVTARECARFTMRHTTAHPVGRRSWTQRLSPHVERRVSYPTFAPPQPQGRSEWFNVTGYSFGCGTPNPLTASGTVPAVGTVASNVLPMGTHVYVPSLGYTGVVRDTGAPLDLFAVNCAATYAYTGWRLVYVS